MYVVRRTVVLFHRSLNLNLNQKNPHIFSFLKKILLLLLWRYSTVANMIYNNIIYDPGQPGQGSNCTDYSSNVYIIFITMNHT